ncbi:MAG: DNA recombination protein RmuC [Bacteroidales bacterium]
MEILYILIGLIVGFAIGWLSMSGKKLTDKARSEQQLREMEAEKNNFISELDKAKSIAEDRFNKAKEELLTLQEAFKQEQEKTLEQSNRLTKAEVEYGNLREKLDTQKTELEDLQKKFTTEFENIANKILKTHSQEFTQVNLKNIGDILNPLREKIGDFEKKVNEAYDKELRDKIGLREEIKKLYEMNSRISEEANNLTKALKGDSKKQGNWGEMVLDKIMERSGLTKGNEYETQVSVSNDEGKRIQPDVIVFLPDKKHIIIDSKVSLVAYEKYVNASSEEERQQYMRDHIASIRNHIKGLSEKNYQSAKGINSPDFVLLFIPIESSFGVAVQADQQLFNDAWDNKIVIVSPSTLLATLKTIASIWKQENQTRNAIEIARQGGALYDKFVGFVDDLEKVGKNIEQLQNTYKDAMDKLQTGKGNLVNKAETIRKLGVKTSKQLSEKYLDGSENQALEETK